jgi:hypothetical protein
VGPALLKALGLQVNFSFADAQVASDLVTALAAKLPPGVKSEQVGPADAPWSSYLMAQPSPLGELEGWLAQSGTEVALGFANDASVRVHLPLAIAWQLVAEISALMVRQIVATAGMVDQLEAALEQSAADPAQASHPAPPGGPMSAPIPADPARPPAASILADMALQHLGTAADDCDDAAIRLRWLANDARLEHGLQPDEWLSPEQLEQLLQLATLADRVAAGARAVLGNLSA